MSFNEKDFNDSNQFNMPKDDYSDVSTSVQMESEFDSSSEPENKGTSESSIDLENLDTTYIAILSAIVLVVLYILYSIYSALTPVEGKEIEQVAPPVVEVQKKPEVTSSAANELSELKDKIEDHQSVVDGLSDDSQYFLETTKKITSSLDSLTTKVEDLSTQLSKYAAIQDEISAKIKKQEEEAKKSKSEPAPLQVFYIRALVEGRAWIEGDNGFTETVVVGQTLPDYGTITGIYVTQGIVTTSSGRQIEFNDND